MKSKATTIICGILMLCILSGCSLAQKNAGAGASNATEDRLIGAFITTEPLDFSPVDNKTQKDEERLYATTRTNTEIDKKTGKTDATKEYSFKNLKGMSFFAPTTSFGKGEYDSYIASTSDATISEPNLSPSYGNTTDSLTMKGTVYIDPLGKKRIFYFNPVYQTLGGTVYLVGGSGMVIDPNGEEGDLGSMAKNETATIKENGKTKKTYHANITITVVAQFAPEKIVIVQIDANSSVLSRTTYQPGALPETFTTVSKADALIVETHAQTTTGAPRISRKIYDRGTETFGTFSKRADGVFLTHETKVVWK